MSAYFGPSDPALAKAFSGPVLVYLTGRRRYPIPERRWWAPWRPKWIWNPWSSEAQEVNLTWQAGVLAAPGVAWEITESDVTVEQILLTTLDHKPLWSNDLTPRRYDAGHFVATEAIRVIP